MSGFDLDRAGERLSDKIFASRTDEKHVDERELVTRALFNALERQDLVLADEKPSDVLCVSLYVHDNMVGCTITVARLSMSLERTHEAHRTIIALLHRSYKWISVVFT